MTIFTGSEKRRQGLHALGIDTRAAHIEILEVAEALRRRGQLRQQTPGRHGVEAVRAARQTK